MAEFKFTSMTQINKGWSEDKKFCVTNESSTKYLLRISPLGRFKTR
ncbi:MAG: hypothetical protein QMC67_03300 [Candidatus Wallbacteria bacterium]